tara:strand:+ start:2154 stop:2402 length:249 start_codon:yes stop_codon:yes gene_type:complete
MKITINDPPNPTSELKAGQFWLDETNKPPRLYHMVSDCGSGMLILNGIADGYPYSEPSNIDPFGGDRGAFRQIFSFSVEAGE